MPLLLIWHVFIGNCRSGKVCHVTSFIIFRDVSVYRFGFCTKADLIARLCDDAKKEAKIENGLEDIARLRWVVVRRSRKKNNMKS